MSVLQQSVAIQAKRLANETDIECGTDANRRGFRYTQLVGERCDLAAAASANGNKMAESSLSRSQALDIEIERLGGESRWTPPRDNPGTGGLDDEPQFVDQHGHGLHVLRKTDRLTNLPSTRPNRGGGPTGQLSLGKAIIGLATSRWDGAESERLAMAEGGNAVGGYLVGDEFSSTVIDFARNKAAIIQAGGVTIPWDGSDTLLMARVSADPTFAVVGENTAIDQQAMTFSNRRFTANKIACIVAMSRELAEDAENAAELVETTIGKALATELDRLGLVGSGSQEPNGLLNYTGIAKTDSIGAIAWEDVHAAAVAIENRNHTANAYITSPTIAGDLGILTSGDGSNSAKMWLGPPPSLKDVPRHATKNCPDANLFIGDWSQFVFAVRQDAMIEITTSGGDSFAKHQLLIKCTFRGDVGCLDETAFHVLEGITT